MMYVNHRTYCSTSKEINKGLSFTKQLTSYKGERLSFTKQLTSYKGETGYSELQVDYPNVNAILIVIKTSILRKSHTSIQEQPQVYSYL